MPILQNAKHEKFCQEYILNSQNATKAYIEAGYSAKGDSIRVNASNLLTNPNIKARIDELRLQTEEKHLITREGLIAEMNELKLLATADNQLGVVAKVIDMKARMIGAFTDKHEITGANGGAIETVTLDKKENKKARESMLKDDNL